MNINVKHERFQRFEEVLGHAPTSSAGLRSHFEKPTPRDPETTAHPAWSATFTHPPPNADAEGATPDGDPRALAALSKNSPGRDEEKLEPPAFADPLARALLAMRPVAPESSVASPAAVTVPATVEVAVARLVRRIAWGGDGRRGTARIELGAGDLAGATLLVAADGASVTVELEVPPGVDASSWRARLAERLAARGVHVESFEAR